MQGFLLFGDDWFDQRLRALRLGRLHLADPAARIFASFLATYGTLTVLALAQGVLVGPTARESFLSDFAAMGQFLVAVPGMLLLEPRIDGQVRRALALLRDSGLLGEDPSPLERDLARVRRAKQYWWMYSLFFVFAVTSSAVWLMEELADGRSSWHARVIGADESVTFAGFYCAVVAVPIWFFLLLRWIWKIFQWVWILWRLSRLKLRLVASHPDRAGGLGFLGEVQAAFGALIFVVGVAVASTVTYKITVEGAQIQAYATAGPALAFVILAPIAFLAPLLLFSAHLHDARAEAWRQISSLAAWQARRRWKRLTKNRARPDGAREIGRDDAGPVEAFEAIRSMRVVPFDLRVVGRLVLAAATPMAPLLARHLPLVKGFLDALGEITS